MAAFFGLRARQFFHAGMSHAATARCGAILRGGVIALAMLVPAGALEAAPPFGASGGDGPTTTSAYNLAGTGWFVDDGTFPASLGGFQEIAYDPAAGPWHKRLLGGDGGEFAASDTGVGALMVFSVTEQITVGGTVPWMDWHELILQPGWRWLDDRAGSGEPTIHFASGVTIPGLEVSFTDPTPTSGGQLDFTFDPLAPGTNIRITKRLIFEGLDPLLPGDVFLGTLDIYQYPTVPEPATLVLAIAGMLAVMGSIRARGWR
jgi:hypothetical protein